MSSEYRVDINCINPQINNDDFRWVAKITRNNDDLLVGTVKSDWYFWLLRRARRKISKHERGEKRLAKGTRSIIVKT